MSQLTDLLLLIYVPPAKSVCFQFLQTFLRNTFLRNVSIFYNHSLQKLIKVFIFSDKVDCSDHDDCSGGRKCINLFCGDKKYFEALGEMTCNKDQFCKVHIRSVLINNEKSVAVLFLHQSSIFINQLSSSATKKKWQEENSKHIF